MDVGIWQTVEGPLAGLRGLRTGPVALKGAQQTLNTFLNPAGHGVSRRGGQAGGQAGGAGIQTLLVAKLKSNQTDKQKQKNSRGLVVLNRDVFIPDRMVDSVRLGSKVLTFQLNVVCFHSAMCQTNQAL